MRRQWAPAWGGGAEGGKNLEGGRRGGKRRNGREPRMEPGWGRAEEGGQGRKDTLVSGNQLERSGTDWKGKVIDCSFY